MDTGPSDVLAIGLDGAERRAIADRCAVGVTAVDGSEVTAGAENGRPSCVVIAHEPPAIDAVDVVERLAETEPAVPIVVYAAAESDTLAADVVAAGATRYVPRRRGTEALAAAVEGVVRDGERRHRRDRDRAILDELLVHAPLEVYVKDPEARHVRSTKTVQYDEIVGRTEAEFFDEDRADLIYREDLEVVETGEPIVDRVTEYEVTASEIDDLDAGWLRSWKYPWYEDGELCGLIGFTQDVTRMMETEQELTRKNERLEEFASVVSHDLRNPLNVARGHLQLAREGGDGNHFDAIQRAHDRMEEIIEDLLRLTRDSSRNASLLPVEFAPHVRDAWETVDTGSTTLAVDADAEVILADQGLLRQVLENLFRNAAEHAGEGTTVTVGIEADGFYVADDGPGLPGDVRARLNAGEFGQSGLGLNIVRTIADRHGWELEASESERGGARFSFRRCTVIAKPNLRSVDRSRVDLTDAGSVGGIAEGSVRRDGEARIIEGTGRNLWRNVNEFYFEYGTVTGDADLFGRIVDFDATQASAKAGLIVKSDLGPRSPHGFVGCTHDRGTENLWQLSQGGGTQSRMPDDAVEPPIWYRIKREGDVVTTFTSPDGNAWRPVDEQRLPLPERALYGLAVVSHDDEVRATATFEDVSLASVTWE